MVLDQESILAHEQICEYNEVSCIYHTCNKGSSAHKLLDHLKTKHAHDISMPSRNVQMNGTNFLVTLKMKQEHFDFPKNRNKDHLTKCYFYSPIALQFNEKIFLVHVSNQIWRTYTLIWLQLFGSKEEAEKFHYWIEVSDAKYGTLRHTCCVNFSAELKEKIFFNHDKTQQNNFYHQDN